MPNSTPRTRSSISPMPSRCRGRISARHPAARRPAHDRVHLVLLGAERAADRDAVAFAGGYGLRRLDTQVLEHAALDDAVDKLAIGAALAVPVQAATQPAVGALGRALRVLARDVERGALVEDERQVGAQRSLDLHRRLRCHETLGAVEIGAEADALLLDGQDPALSVGAVRRAPLDLVRDRAVAHREDLEAAGVGDDRAAPAHELVQAAEPRDPLMARVEEEVERVAQDDVVAQRRDLGRQHALDRRLGRERDEGGRADVAVRRVQDPRAGPRARVAGGDRQGGHRGHARSEGCP